MLDVDVIAKAVFLGMFFVFLAETADEDRLKLQRLRLNLK